MTFLRFIILFPGGYELILPNPDGSKSYTLQKCHPQRSEVRKYFPNGFTE
jgi:hypothetical protein